MTDEEKKAIDKFKQLKDYHQTYYGYTWFKVEVCADNEMKQNIDTILNLIKKQQKEIEEYKKQLDLDYVEENYISKDKIKAKIEELEEAYEDNYILRILQSLLEKE